MQNVAFWLSLFGQAPLCVTSDELGCYLVFAVLFPSFSSVLPPLGGPGQTILDWSLDFSEGWTTFMQCGSTQSDCRLVFLILLLLCVFVYLTAELPLIVLYSSLPLRKLLPCLWLLCNSEWVCVCGCRVVANPAPTYTNYFMFFLKSSCFSWFALCSPKQGFVISRSVNDVRYDEYHCSLISLTLWLVRWEDIFSTKIWLPKYPCPALAFCNFLTL